MLFLFRVYIAAMIRHESDQHSKFLKKVCRICGRYLPRHCLYNMRYLEKQLIVLAGIDVSSEPKSVYPGKACRTCINRLSKAYGFLGQSGDKAHQKSSVVIALPEFEGHRRINCTLCHNQIFEVQSDFRYRKHRAYTEDQKSKDYKTVNAVTTDSSSQLIAMNGSRIPRNEKGQYESRKTQLTSLTSSNHENGDTRSPSMPHSNGKNSVDIDLSQTEHELRKLSFRNPGKFMEDFDPEKSSREMRKLKRRMCKDTIRKNQMYDSRGLLLHNSEDRCDCLDIDCPGCHFPCPKCSSHKCGNECRANRRWCYDLIEVEGSEKVLQWPSQPDPLY